MSDQTYLTLEECADGCETLRVTIVNARLAELARVIAASIRHHIETAPKCPAWRKENGCSSILHPTWSVSAWRGYEDYGSDVVCQCKCNGIITDCDILKRGGDPTKCEVVK